MLITFWDRLSNAGVDDKIQSSEARYTVTVNRFAAISGHFAGAYYTGNFKSLQGF